MDNGTKYEVIAKNTGETYEVTEIIFGDEKVIFKTSLGYIHFQNKGKMGDLKNELFSVREIGTHSQPDGTGTVSDMGIPTE